MACMKLGSKTDTFKRQGQAWYVPDLCNSTSSPSLFAYISSVFDYCKIFFFFSCFASLRFNVHVDVSNVLLFFPPVILAFSLMLEILLCLNLRHAYGSIEILVYAYFGS